MGFLGFLGHHWARPAVLLDKLDGRCALLFGGICIQRLKVVLSLRLVDTERSLGPRSGGSRHEGVCMKRKLTIYGIQSLQGYERTRTHAR